MKTYFGKILAVFFILGFVFIPLTLNGKDGQFQFTDFLFSKPIAFFQPVFFPKALREIDFSSDTIALNLLVLLLFLIAVLIVLLLRFSKLKSDRIVFFARMISSHYIAFVLLKYGFDKIFKTQFYLPEPNILYTPFGNLTKDILYWSTIGTSYPYSISMGIIEVMTAILILFRRTRILGLVVAIGIFLNIILINFGFDISVKTFSMFLFLAAIFAIYPNLKALFNFFILHKNEQITIEEFKINPGLKIMIVGLMLLQILFPYFQSGNFNDDSSKRNFLHGAYQVTEIIKGSDTLQPAEFPIERVFVHRNNYIIFQAKNNETVDYHFEINEDGTQLILQDYNNKKIKTDFEFVEKYNLLCLNFNKYHMVCTGLDWQNLPALQNKTHSTVDEIR